MPLPRLTLQKYLSAPTGYERLPLASGTVVPRLCRMEAYEARTSPEER